MAFVNFATREITAKLVFYGPGLGGKTTSLQHIHSTLPGENRGKMISLATEEDRTIYFDFLPLHLGKIQDFAVRVQLYTVPGQVRYNATRKLVLRGADGLVFVADSQKHKKLADAESYNNMEQNLREHGKDLKELPHILQFNKIDLPGIMNSEELNQLLNKFNVPFFETCATNGIGVFDALKSITKLVFNDLSKKALLQRKRVATGSSDYAMERRYEQTPESAAAAKPAEPTSAPVFFGGASRGSEPRLTSFAGKAVPSAPPPPPSDEYTELEMEEFEPESTVGQTPAAIPFPRPESAHLQEVEPVEELDETPMTRTPPADLDQTGTFERVTEAEAQQEQITSFSPVEPKAFTYRSLYADAVEFRGMMEMLEREISLNEQAAAISTAKGIYTYLLNSLYPAEFSMDGLETTKILALNVKFKRYLRFKQLLAAEKGSQADLLFLHHFLTELYLSIREF